MIAAEVGHYKLGDVRSVVHMAQTAAASSRGAQGLNVPKKPAASHTFTEIVNSEADPIEIILYNVAPKHQCDWPPSVSVMRLHRRQNRCVFFEVEQERCSH